MGKRNRESRAKLPSRKERKVKKEPHGTYKLFLFWPLREIRLGLLTRLLRGLRRGGGAHQGLRQAGALVRITVGAVQAHCLKSWITLSLEASE